MTAVLRAITLPGFAIDSRKFMFSLSSYLAAVATLGLTFAFSLPRPWWALLTVYATAQPLAGAFRPKVLYRLSGIWAGAIVSLLVVPNLQNSPELLVLCLALWTGLCLYLAVLDRTPRAFMFQMAGFSAAVISFPYLDDPSQVFMTTVSRVQEMTIAILCVSAAHAVLQPWSITPTIRARARAFLEDAVHWVAKALGSQHTRLEHGLRRKLAADVTELGMIAIHLPFDMPASAATRRTVWTLQEHLASMLPLATEAANQLDVLREQGGLDRDMAALVDDVGAWLSGARHDRPAEMDVLVARCQSLARRHETHGSDWHSLLIASFSGRMAEFIQAHRVSRDLIARLHDEPVESDASPCVQPVRQRGIPVVRDHALAGLAGMATAAAVMLYCAVWVFLAWPSGSATAAFAALINCSFALQDDPAPALGRYLRATLLTFPIVAAYLFVILPAIDGYLMLSVALAPVLLVFGYLQADPARSVLALPMFSCLIVGLGFVDRFQPDFAGFVNTGLAQVGGIVATIAITRLFRSSSARHAAHRHTLAWWRELEGLARNRRHPDVATWTGVALDRIGQIAARMAVTPEDDELHEVDGLADLRVGRNVFRLRHLDGQLPAVADQAVERVLAGISGFFGMRNVAGKPLPPQQELLPHIDQALAAVLDVEARDLRHEAVLALTGLRCDLFPQAPAYQAR